MAKEKKIYDFNVNTVKNRLVSTFKKRKNEATIADLVTATGLPKYQVEQGVKVVLDEYAGHLKATESGELLYYFPGGMRSRLHGFVPGFKRFIDNVLTVISKVLAFLFKVWIMVMLVGYFILFLLIIVLAIVASIAISASDKDRERSRGRGGIGSFYLVIHLLDLVLRVFFYVSLTKRFTPARNVPSGPPPRPFYKSVFAFVFGEENFNKDWAEQEKQKILSFIRTHKGVILAEELVTFTGKDPDEVQLLLNRYLLEYEGEPQVTEEGTIVYFFPELLRTQASTLEKEMKQSSFRPLYKPLVPFNTNPKKTNGWIIFFNLFNLVLGGYFFFFSFIDIANLQTAPLSTLYLILANVLSEFMLLPEAQALIFIVLGLIPFSFSLFFFLIPFLRNLRRKKENEKIKQANLRKKIYAHVLSHPAEVEANAINVYDEEEKPSNAGNFIQKELDRLAALKHGEFSAVASNRYVYHFPELQREITDVTNYRNKIKLSDYTVGKVIFDSSE